MKLSLPLLVEQLLLNGFRLEIINPRDIIYLRNQYYALLNLTEVVPLDNEQLSRSATLTQICSDIISTLNEKVLTKIGETHEQQINRLINVMLPLPSQIEEHFESTSLKSGIGAALEWYYQLCCHSNYIQLEAIKKNKNWVTPSNYGNLEITINLSKPEKDPKEIAKLKQQSKNKDKYPSCLLCIENEGYAGSLNHPSRFNHRLIKLNLNSSNWYFQFSPYAYYPEHSIVINEQHKPMVIDHDCLRALFDFVDLVPHYLIGSNSDIPIVGGSILNHDHFQAGNHVFPIEKAQTKFSLNKHNTKIDYLYWPISTLRLTGSKADLINCSDVIIKAWYHFSMPELDIVAFSPKGVRHNAVTPVLRRLDNNQYQLYLMLRNNRTNTKYPDGIFHPHQNLHHIKKENIGLIEAMGLAILPGRLDYELKELNKFMGMNDANLANIELLYDEQMHKHEEWLQYLYQNYSNFDKTDNFELLKTEVGSKFCQVLEDAGVFKQNQLGDNGIKWFVNSL